MTNGSLKYVCLMVSGRSIWFIDMYLVSLIWFVDLYLVSLIWYPGIIFDVHGKSNIYIVLFICDFKNGWPCIRFVTKSINVVIFQGFVCLEACETKVGLLILWP